MIFRSSPWSCQLPRSWRSFLLFFGLHGGGWRDCDLCGNSRRRANKRWGFLLFQGIASLAAAAIAFMWPGLTVVAFVLLIAAWSIVSGCLMLAAAMHAPNRRGGGSCWGCGRTALRLPHDRGPLSGAVVLTWWLGAFALVFGAALIILSLKLRSRYSGRPAVAAPRPVS